MSDALWISIGAVGIVAIIVTAVTWMLFSPGKGVRPVPRVQPAGAAPLERALFLAATASQLEMPACSEDEDMDISALRERWQKAESSGDTETSSRIAQVLCALGDVDPAVQGRAQDPAPEPRDLAPLEDEAWISSVAAPSLDRALTGLMALLGPEVITWASHPPSRYGLLPRERADSLTEVPLLVTLAPAVARAAGVPDPLFFITPATQARLVHINVVVHGRYVSALAVGKEALAMEDAAVMRFMLGRKLTFMRAEHLLCTAVEGPEDLRALHLAAAQILDPGTLPAPPPQVAGLPQAEALGRLRAHFGEAEVAQGMRQVLRAAAATGVGADPAAPDRWEKWLVASAETSFRFGLLVCGSLPPALRILDLDGVIPGTQRQHAQCYQALYKFYLSREYAKLSQPLIG